MSRIPAADPTNESLRARIATAIQELPALPAVVNRIMQETQNESISAAELERLLASDQALATKALRVVNSAYYGMSKQVSSLNQAVVILGLQQLRVLILSIGAMSVIKPQTSTQRELHRKFWLHSIASSNAAAIVARRKRLPAAAQELIYIGGLLHDVGRLFLFTNFGELYTEIDRRVSEGESLNSAEVKVLAVTHGQIGQVLGAVWKFPPSLVELMGDHDGPFELSQQNNMCIHAAHELANSLIYRTNLIQSVRPEVHEWLGWSEPDWISLRQEVEQRVAAIEQHFAAIAA